MSEEEPRDERQVVTGLHFLLLKTSLDDLATLIDRLHLKFSITCENEKRSVYKMRVFSEGLPQYQATGRGLKATIANCLHDVLRGETKDIHAYDPKDTA